MKIAFIGAGRIAESHLRSLDRVGRPFDLRITGFFDPDRNRARRMAQLWGGEAFATEEALLDKRPDAVYVVSPTPYHYDQAISVVERGYALFLEKPLALERTSSLALRDRIKSSGIIHCVGLQWRYRKLTQLLKKRLSNNPPSLMTARWLWFTPPVPWLRRRETGGGQVFDQLIHIVDLFLYLAGRARSVSALYHHETKAPDFDNWDVNSLQLSFISGCIANLSCTYKLNIPMEERVWIEIVASNLLCCFGTKRLSFFDSKGQTTILEQGDTKEDMVGRDEVEQAFLRAVKSGSQEGILADIEEASQTMEVLFAANRSSETEQPVMLNGNWDG